MPSLETENRTVTGNELVAFKDIPVGKTFGHHLSPEFRRYRKIDLWIDGESVYNAQQEKDPSIFTWIGDDDKVYLFD